MSSMLGALVICLFNIRQNNKLLAVSLGFAAGVMMYISAVDIYAGKSVGMFESAGFDHAMAFTYATICFFCGFPIIWVLDKVCHWLADRGAPGMHMEIEGPQDLLDPTHGHAAKDTPSRAHTPVNHQGSKDQSTGTAPPGCAVSPAAALGACGTPCTCDAETVTSLSQAESWAVRDTESGLAMAQGPVKSPPALVVSDSSTESGLSAESARSLVRSGLLCALAVALHNLPEGLVTFVGYMDSMGSGITTAIAIAIHNIPEGLVIASAMSAGTGSKLKGVLWALVASCSEPIGGLIGLAVVCGGQMTDTVFGILFGLVAGIMVYVSIKELLPTAHRFDPQDKVVSVSVLGGAVIMACSLIAIAFSTAPAPTDEGTTQ
ncbi:hypothetical protein HYH03_003007 [Edaphochlamys debaryana]|uniref:Zinc transporter n=1 Tax=Edaphochlamys debaryana TaxID=47281 RepID=A0A835YJI0_9CHLO|nr:hypothetical protein HYH03_003007 [Edaphochlamys debaryana]|eukprot:KAG2498814.1 hypothetical protein HYH03_003007 [Edaphochlamys debaryana]